MTDFFGALSRDVKSGPFPDPNVGTPRLPSAAVQPYPPGPFNPIGASPSIVPFERVGTFDLLALGVDVNDPNTTGQAQNASVIAGQVQNLPHSFPSTIRGAGVISRQIQVDWFEKWHVFPGELALGNVLTTQFRELEIFNGFRTESRTWQGFTNNAGAGVTITNLPALPLLMPAQSSFVNQVQVSTAGPPEISGTLDFDVDLVPPDVIIVPITGNRITIFPFRPQTPITERLEFKTDILRLFDGTEQRLSLRGAPRQNFEFTIRVDDSVTRDAINSILFDWQARVFGVPVWFEAKPLLAPLRTTDTVVQVDTADADFRDGGLVTIYESNFSQSTVQILTVNPTNLVLQVAIGRAFTTDAIVIPTRTAYTGPQLNNSRYAIGPADYKVGFTILDNIDLSDASAFPSYQGVGQTTPKPLLDGLNFMPGQTIGEGNKREIERLDHETGPFLQVSAWEKGKPIYQFGFESNSYAETWDVRTLAHFLRGSQLSFYVPTGRTDFKPLADIANNDTQIDFTNYGFDQFVQGITPRSDIRVLRKDGTYSLHQITGTSTISNDVERIEFTPGITPALPLIDLDRIEIVTLSRVANDQVRFVHRRPGETRIDISLIGVPS